MAKYAVEKPSTLCPEIMLNYNVLLLVFTYVQTKIFLILVLYKICT